MLLCSLDTQMGCWAVGTIKKCHVTLLIKTKQALTPQHFLWPLWLWPWCGHCSPCAGCEQHGSARSARGVACESHTHPSQDWKPSQAQPEWALRGEQRKSASQNISPTWAWCPPSLCDVALEVAPVLAVLCILVQHDIISSLKVRIFDFPHAEDGMRFPAFLLISHEWAEKFHPFSTHHSCSPQGQLVLGPSQPHRVFWGGGINRWLKVWTQEGRLVLSLPSLSKPKLFHLWNGSVYLIPRNVC